MQITKLLASRQDPLFVENMKKQEDDGHREWE